VIRPSLAGCCVSPTARAVGPTNGPPPATRGGFAALAEFNAPGGRSGLQSGQQALTRIAVNLAAGRPGRAGERRDCVVLLADTAGIRATSGSEEHATDPLFYQLLRLHRVFGEDPPAIVSFSPAVGSRAASS
jgi:hypothetical protein